MRGNTTSSFKQNYVMPRKAITGGGQRGRSMSRGSGGGGAKRQGYSVSRSRSVSRANGQDGVAKRAFAVGQAYSMYHDPFPRTMRAVLRYTECINFNTSAGLAQQHFFRGGLIFDPNYTGVGYQPYGHDTYQAIFNHYRVVKSVCKITNTTSGSGNIMGITLSDDVSVTTDFDQIKLVKPSKCIPLATSTEAHTIAMVYNSEQAFPGQVQNTTALFGNNPAEEQYFCIWVTGSNPLGDPSAISVMVTIEYYVEMSELKELDKS